MRNTMNILNKLALNANFIIQSWGEEFPALYVFAGIVTFS
ncbi:hypothetical protein [Enterobacter phage vB-EclM_KMB20]|nr:hypothetical protein [Enterobacter phage vB-EclM_KMB20]